MAPLSEAERISELEHIVGTLIDLTCRLAAEVQTQQHELARLKKTI